MAWQQIQADLDHIDCCDDTYRITADNTYAPLAASIEVAGLINPPLLCAKNGHRYGVLSGFRRISACRHLQMDAIPARLMHSDTTARQMALLAVAENAGQRALNLVEISRSLDLLQRVIPEKETVLNLARSLGLPGNAVFVEKIVSLCRLPETLQAAIISETISLNTARELAVWDTQTVDVLSGLFAELRLSTNKQREILTHLKEIALREDSPPAAILKATGFQQTISRTDLNRNQKASILRERLRSRRFPNLTAAQQQFNDRLKKLALGQDVQLKPPPNFESGQYALKLQFRNIAELKTRIESLRKVANNPGFKKMIGEI